MYKQIQTGKFTTKELKRTKKSKGTYGVLVRVLVCAFLFFTFFAFYVFDTPVTNRVKTGVVSALTFEIDVDKTLGKLKFVQNTDVDVNDSITTTASVDSFSLPVEKYVVEKQFGGEEKFVSLKMQELCDIKAPCSGVVENVQSEGKFEVTIDHGNNLKSVIKFNGAMAVMKEGDKLNKGDYIGIIEKGEILEFCVIENGKNKDPMDYIK